MRLNHLKAIPNITVEEHSKSSISVIADDGYRIDLEYITTPGIAWRFINNITPTCAAHLTLRYQVHKVMNP